MSKPIIGIPKKGDDESFYIMLDSLVDSTNYFEEIVVATPDKDAKPILIRGITVKVIKKVFKTPLEAYNELFEYAKKKKKDLFVTQTDVLFPKMYKRDWLEMMSNMAQEDGVGAVTTLNGYGVAGEDYIAGMPWLGGWCTYFPFITVDKVGGYDKDFPNGYGVDIDHSYRMQRAKLAMRVINYWVDHHMMNEREHDNDPNTEKMKQESSKYFKKKWNIK